MQYSAEVESHDAIENILGRYVHSPMAHQKVLQLHIGKTLQQHQTPPQANNAGSPVGPDGQLAPLC